ncbi:hypothetical protein KIN20_009912 [Parelaphostrongylus tenuis]|uniref:Uncharacterized protein n=1 Tax=Parelaphostrongylus tenuis TaxID=148309 RepID=A0AAD5M732_PARTN|nr:hypothetical protein KIN20_009912 [Parelaphostrongylus tenuis]
MHILAERVVLTHLMEAGLVEVITIEPGCHFSDTFLEAALNDPNQAKFLVKSEIDKYRGQGPNRGRCDDMVQRQRKHE